MLPAWKCWVKSYQCPVLESWGGCDANDMRVGSLYVYTRFCGHVGHVFSVTANMPALLLLQGSGRFAKVGVGALGGHRARGTWLREG